MTAARQANRRASAERRRVTRHGRVALLANQQRSKNINAIGINLFLFQGN